MQMSLVRAASIRLSSRIDRGALAFLLLLFVSACHAAPRLAPAPAAPAAAGGISRLQREIETILAAPALTRSYWGILVRSAKSNNTLYSLNAGRLLMPGSTMKIVTLAAAAERLGWDYVYDTQLVAAGPIESGTLNGDLIVVGSGDPSILDGEAVASGVFADWAEALKANGIRTISGRIIGDDNAFDDETLGPGWTWDDLPGRDAAGVSALQYNENTVQATITPGAAIGAAALVRFAPPGSGLDLDNELTTAAPGTVPSISARRSAGSSRLELRCSWAGSSRGRGSRASTSSPVRAQTLMNLLYLAHRIPYPPDKGDKIRSFHQVRGLSERHTIHLVTFADAREDLAHAAAMRRYCRSVEVVYRNPRTALLRAGLAVLTGDSLSAAAFHSGTLQRAVEKLLATERIDAAIVFSSAMAQYLPYPPPIPLILDMVDVDSEKWRT